MRSLTRGAAALLLGSSLSVAAAQTPAPTTPPPGAPAAAPAAPAAAPGTAAVAAPPMAPAVRPAGTAATVNGQPIAEVAVYRSLRQFPPAHHEMARKEILSHLIENAVIDQYLNAIKVTVEPKEIESTVADLKKELADAKRDFQKELDAMVLTPDEFQTEVVAQMKWEKFLKQQGTDEALKKLFESSPDMFDGSLVRCRHILMSPAADPAKQKEAGDKLRGIRAAIEAEAAKAVAALPPTADPLAKEQARGQKTDELFAAYAKEHSACPSKKDGGDLNFFPRAGAMVEPFAKAAFAMKQYEMSDVVSTEFGQHLILVTAKKAGTPKKFEEVKEDVRLLYAMRLREAVLNQMKPKAQITINPAPAPAAGAAATAPAVTPMPVPPPGAPTAAPAPVTPPGGM